MITIATDGSRVGTKDPIGWGGWAWVSDDGRQDSGAVELVTSNAMELMAVLKALVAVTEDDILIQSDSTYVVSIFEEWYAIWQAVGKVKLDKVAHLDLIEAILMAKGSRTVRFEHVPGHSGHELNEQADKLARKAARDFRKIKLGLTTPSAVEVIEALPEVKPLVMAKWAPPTPPSPAMIETRRKIDRFMRHQATKMINLLPGVQARVLAELADLAEDPVLAAGVRMAALLEAMPPHHRAFLHEGQAHCVWCNRLTFSFDEHGRPKHGWCPPQSPMWVGRIDPPEYWDPMHNVEQRRKPQPLHSRAGRRKT